MKCEECSMQNVKYFQQNYSRAEILRWIWVNVGCYLQFFENLVEPFFPIRKFIFIARNTLNRQCYASFVKTFNSKLSKICVVKKSFVASCNCWNEIKKLQHEGCGQSWGALCTKRYEVPQTTPLVWFSCEFKQPCQTSALVVDKERSKE